MVLQIHTVHSQGSFILFSVPTHRLFDQIVRVSGTSVLGMRTHEVRSALTAAPAGEMRVGVVRPRDPAAVKKAIIEQEKLQKRDR